MLYGNISACVMTMFDFCFGKKLRIIKLKLTIAVYTTNVISSNSLELILTCCRIRIFTSFPKDEKSNQLIPA